MAGKFSAYLSIYNDWDILPAALRSVAPYVDELVVVDGAYDWMAPYLTRLGIDPTRSNPNVYAALEASGIPFRVIARTWPNEPEKRRQGYAACTHDMIYRIDADEVMFFNEASLEAALRQGAAVGSMQMPNYVAPGWISRDKNLTEIEQQCFLFDRRQISPDIHLNYLWLILTADSLPLAGQKPLPVFTEPLAFNAHLTGWRTPATGVNRAAFYNLNWMRQNGVPWIESLRGRPLTDVAALFDLVPPAAFLSSLRRGRIATGMIEAPENRVFHPTPLDHSQEATFLDVFAALMDSLTEQNRNAVAEPQQFLTTNPTLLDLSTQAARDAIAPRGTVTIQISAVLHAAKVRLLTYSTGESANTVVELPAKVTGPIFQVTLPEADPARGQVLRQGLEFDVWPQLANMVQTFRVLI